MQNSLGISIARHLEDTSPFTARMEKQKAKLTTLYPLMDIIYISVGPATAQKREIFAVKKSIIMAESMYFAILLKYDPYSVKYNFDYDPDIFEMALEFMEQKRLNPIRDVDQLLALDSLADLLVMDKLKETCVKKMASSVSFQTVWKIYDTNYPPVIVNCEWLLKTRTLELLGRPEFLHIKPETLHRFLELDEMNFESEWALVDACIRYAETEKHGSKKQVFRDFALQLLRLLSLKRYNLAALESFLTDEEMQFLEYWAGLSSIPAPHVPNLSLERKPRRSQHAFYLVIDPDRDMHDESRLIWDWPFIESEKSTFVLSFETKKWIRIQGFNYIWPVAKFSQKTDSLPEPEFPVRIITKLNMNNGKEYKEDRYTHIPVDTLMNRSSWFDLDKVVPESVHVSIEVYFEGSWKYRKFFDTSEASIFKCSDPCIQEMLGNVTLKHLDDGKERAEEFNTTVFKSLKIKLI